MSPRPPPRHVPTLTDVVGSGQAQAARPAPEPEALPGEDEVTQRVMARIDDALERRLREAVAARVVRHTQSLMAGLRAEIEEVVREVVAEALAEELARRRDLGSSRAPE